MWRASQLSACPDFTMACLCTENDFTKSNKYFRQTPWWRPNDVWRMWPQCCARKLHFDPCLSCTDKQNEQVFLHSCRPAIESSAYLGIWQPSLNQRWWNMICSRGTHCECSLWSLPLKYGIENSCVLAFSPRSSLPTTQTYAYSFSPAPALSCALLIF